MRGKTTDRMNNQIAVETTKTTVAKEVTIMKEVVTTEKTDKMIVNHEKRRILISIQIQISDDSI